MFYRPEKQIGGAECEAAALKKAIISSADTINDRKNIYYFSENGNDSNDGFSPDKAKKSLNMISEISLSPGDAILLERGSIFRISDQIYISCNNVSIGAYGKGDKPYVYGSVRNYADSNLWKKTDIKNVWSANVPICPKRVGGIFFNDDSLVGNWKLYLDELDENGDFYNDNSCGIVYLYWDRGNPGTDFKSIEISTAKVAIRANDINGFYAENISFRYFTFGAFSFGESNGITVKNCIVGWCGGGLYDIDAKSGCACRYGNAFQVWHLAKNIIVSHCWIYQQFDAALTFQGFGDTPADFENIEFSDNLLEYSSMNIEFWVGRLGVDRHISKTENILYKGNIIRFSGYGWAGVQRYKPENQAAILGWNYYYENLKNFVICDNIIDCADCYMIYTKSPKEQPGLEVYNNVYYQKPTSGNHDYVEIVKGLGFMPVDENEFITAISYFDECPKLVKWLG